MQPMLLMVLPAGTPICVPLSVTWIPSQHGGRILNTSIPKETATWKLHPFCNLAFNVMEHPFDLSFWSEKTHVLSVVQGEGA
jgi:hypothetical protein